MDSGPVKNLATENSEVETWSPLKRGQEYCHYFYRIWQIHGKTSRSQGTVKAQTASTKAIHEHPTNPSHPTQSINRKSSCTNCIIFWHPSRPQEHSICHLPATFSFNPINARTIGHDIKRASSQRLEPWLHTSASLFMLIASAVNSSSLNKHKILINK